MALEVVFRPQAEDEALEVRQWYETRRVGLGREFGEALDLLIARIAASPLAFPRVHNETRRSPIKLYLSITTDLPTVRYSGEIVGWEDKRQIPRPKWKVLERLLWTLQPHEGGLYDMSQSADGQSANLLYVRRLQRLDQPFGVDKLEKFFGGGPVSTNRNGGRLDVLDW